MLPDKMAISHSDHLFVSVAFVFCLLSTLVYTSGSYDYTDSRQFKKYPAVPHRNNTRRFVNYTLKPPDNDYSPSEESTEGNAGPEFTKPEDPGQRTANPRAKKMQKISRQGREKWTEHKRNGSGKLAREETTEASKLENDESITKPPLSKSAETMKDTNEEYSDIQDDSGRHETSVGPAKSRPPSTKRHPSSGQNGTSEETATSPKSEESASKKNTRRNTDAEYAPHGLGQAPPETNHRRFQDYRIDSVIEELLEGAEHEDQPPNTGTTHSRRSFKKLLQLEDPKRVITLLPINKEDNGEDSRGDEKSATADSSARKSEEDRENDVGKRSGSGSGGDYLAARRGFSLLKTVKTGVPKLAKLSRGVGELVELKKGIASTLVKSAGELAGLKKDVASTLGKSAGELVGLEKDIVSTLGKSAGELVGLEKDIPSTLGKSARDAYNFGYEKLDAWSNFPPNLSDELFLKKLRFLMHILRSSDTDIPLKCYTRLPFRT